MPCSMKTTLPCRSCCSSFGATSTPAQCPSGKLTSRASASASTPPKCALLPPARRASDSLKLPDGQIGIVSLFACATSPSKLHCMSGGRSVENLSFKNGAVGLHAIAAGPQDGPVVLLLRGFPEFWYGWHRQIEPLAAAGFRVVVPDQRGHNLSSKPSGVASYAVSELVSDVIAIADQLGQEKIFLAGHDWGAAVAWSTALFHQQRIAKLAVLNVPHPSVMRKFLSTRPRQFLR